MIANTENVWDPSNPHGLSIILLFWGVVAGLFIGLNKKLVARPVFRNIPEGANADISMLPGGEDDLVAELGQIVPGFEHLSNSNSVEAELIQG